MMCTTYCFILSVSTKLSVDPTSVPLCHNSDDVPWTTEANSEKLTKKVLFIVADGIPADVIENATVINMKQIQRIGAYTRAYVGGGKKTYTETATISSPGYMSLLTGTWGNKHNVYNNYVKNPNYHYKNIFRLVKELEPDKKIGIFSTWTTNRLKLVGEGLSEAGNITFDYIFDGYELDLITYPHDKKSRYIYNIDQRVTDETTECIRAHAPDLSWVYLQYTDDIGHYFGDSQQFSQSITYLDDQIGRIWKAVDYRMKYHKEDWLVIITTDHGRDPRTGQSHSGQSVRERTTWILTNSQETNDYFRDYQCGIVDILPTITRFMNITIPIESERELDGIPLIGKVSLIEPNVSLHGNQLTITWTVLHNTGNVTIWLSTSNLFKKGIIDNYKLIDIVSIDKKIVIIDIKKYPSDFYKIALEGQYNTVNKWVYRPRHQNKTSGKISTSSSVYNTTKKTLLGRILQKEPLTSSKNST
ncbi:unnamed protein product [Adineta steineri]|uniref:Uncharacterized protein n=1 Tax=Adineta steineri TaxID=433720 RepID=A0A813NMD3_9BILA|nr:unnamed protein product [Adineta steineri]